MPKPGANNRDFPQVLKESYDPALERIRVDALVNDGTDALVINSDGSVTSWIRDSDGSSITLGQKTSALSLPVVFSSDQPIDVTIPTDQIFSMVETGTVDTAFNEVIAVGSGIDQIVVSYIAIQDTRVKLAEVTGTNIAEYTINVNGSPIHKKRTYYGNLDNNFQFSKGYKLILGDEITVNVKHQQSTVGDFAGFILVLKDDI